MDRRHGPPRFEEGPAYDARCDNRFGAHRGIPPSAGEARRLERPHSLAHGGGFGTRLHDVRRGRRQFDPGAGAGTGRVDGPGPDSGAAEGAGGGGPRDNAQLRRVLAAGIFALKGVLFDAGTDTQGYVAVRGPDVGPGIAVLAFRGTQQVKDWMTNLEAARTTVASSDGGTLGHVHEGFNDPFLSVCKRIDELLEGDEDLPLYITGHSLGGALATLAIWYRPGDSLAACYTFGAPRVGDSGLIDRFRTPIYRIVNGVDPVPFVPLSDRAVSFAKHALRFVGTAVVFPARAAFSHSDSLGSRNSASVSADSPAAYSRASSHDTLITGRRTLSQPWSANLFGYVNRS